MLGVKLILLFTVCLLFVSVSFSTHETSDGLCPGKIYDTQSPLTPGHPNSVCSSYSHSTCCRTVGEEVYVKNYLNSIENFLQVDSVCLDAYKTLGCGRQCGPGSDGFINTEYSLMIVCQAFCNDLFDACKNSVINGSGLVIGDLYTNSKAWCEDQSVNGLAVLVNQADECFNGDIFETSTRHPAKLSGPGAQNGPAYLEGCFTLELVDIWENPKVHGGDLIEILISGTGNISNIDTISPPVRDFDNGTYYTCWTAPVPGLYNIHYSINGQSGFTVEVERENSGTCPLRVNEINPFPMNFNYTEGNICPQFDETACCNVEDENNLQDYIENQTRVIYDGFPECLSLQEELLCGLQCDPRQSDYVHASPNGTFIWSICADFCDRIYDACQDVLIFDNNTIRDYYGAFPASYCRSLLPDYLAANDFLIDVSYSDQCSSGTSDRIPSCSQSTILTDPSIGRLAGESFTFAIQTRDRYRNTLTSTGSYTWKLVVISPNSTESIFDLTNDGTGIYSVDVSFTIAGPYSFQISLQAPGSSVSVPCSDLPIHIYGSSPDPSQFFAYGDGLSLAFVGRSTCFNVQARDQYGNDVYVGGSNLSFIGSGPDSDFESSITWVDLDNGTYTACYLGNTEGVYTLNISADGQRISNPDHEIHIFGDIYVAYGEGTVLAYAGEFTTFWIYGIDRFTGQNLTFGGRQWCITWERLDGPTPNIEWSQIDNGDGSYTIQWRSNTSAQLKMDVVNCASGFPVINNPFYPIVYSDAFSPCNTTVSGDLTVGTACTGATSTVIIEARDRFGNRINIGGETFRITFTPIAGVSWNITDNNDGTYSLTYGIDIVGFYTLRIFARGLELCSGPWVIEAQPGAPFYPSGSIAWGGALDGGFSCGFNTFFVQTKDACGNNYTASQQSFDVVVTSPDNLIYNASQIVYGGNGLYNVQFESVKSGRYLLEISSGGIPFANSPILTAEFVGGIQNISPNNSFAYGPGLNNGDPYSTNIFYIQIQDNCENVIPESNNDLSLSFYSGTQLVGVISEACFDYNITNLGNGTYLVEYVTTLSGTVGISIDINIAGTTTFVPIGDSPYSVTFDGPPCSPADCSGHGVCCARSCECFEGYSGSDCSGSEIKIESIKWSDMGSDIIITFDSPTDRGYSIINKELGGHFTCSDLLYFPNDLWLLVDLSLGFNGYCYWQSDSVLILVTGSQEFQFYLATNVTVLAVKPNTLKARGSDFYSNDNGTLTSPDVPPFPISTISVIENIPSGLDSSSNPFITLDATDSVGFGGRPLPSGYVWSVNVVPVVNSPNGSSNEEQISNILKNTSSGSVSFDSASFDSDYEYIFTVKATNFHLQTSEASATIYKKLGLTLPIVEIVGPRTILTYSQYDLLLKGFAYLPDNYENETMLSYSWVVIDTGNHPTYLPDQTYAITPNLYIPAHTLSPNTRYVFRLIVTRDDDLNHEFENSADVEVIVGRSGSLAIVSPGDRAIDRTLEIVLNASASVRSDQNISNLLFVWNCISSFPPNNLCLDNDDKQFYFSSQSPLITLKPASLHPGDYTFKVTIIDGESDKNNTLPQIRWNATKALQDLSSHSTLVNLHVSHSHLPFVNIHQLPNNNLINIGDRLVLSGDVSGRRPISNVQWKVSPDFVSIDDLADGPSDQLELIVKTNSLFPGIIYRFILEAYSGDGTGWNSIDISINQPPTSGDLLSTLHDSHPDQFYVNLDLSAFFWEDNQEQYPWRYKFNFIDSLGNERPLTSGYRLSNKLQVVVPRTTTYIVLYVSDSLGGSFNNPPSFIRINPNGTVCPSDTYLDDGSCYATLASNMLGHNNPDDCTVCSAINNGDLDSLTQWIFILSDLLNTKFNSSSSSSSSSSSLSGSSSSSSNSNSSDSDSFDDDDDEMLRLRQNVRQDLLDIFFNHYVTENTKEGNDTRVLILNNIAANPKELHSSDINRVLNELIRLTGSSTQSSSFTIGRTLNNMLPLNSSAVFSVDDISKRSCPPPAPDAIDYNADNADKFVVLAKNIGIRLLRDEGNHEVSKYLPYPNYRLISQRVRPSVMPLHYELTTTEGKSVTFDIPQEIPNDLMNSGITLVDILFVVWDYDPYAYHISGTYRSGPVVSFFIRITGSNETLEITSLSSPVTFSIPTTPVDELDVESEDIDPTNNCSTWASPSLGWTNNGCFRNDKLSQLDRTVCSCSHLSTFTTIYEFSDLVGVAPGPRPVDEPQMVEDQDNFTEWILLVALCVVACVLIIVGFCIWWFVVVPRHARREHYSAVSTSSEGEGEGGSSRDLKALYLTAAETEEGEVRQSRASGKKYSIRVGVGGEQMDVSSYSTDVSDGSSDSRKDFDTRTATSDGSSRSGSRRSGNSRSGTGHSGSHKSGSGTDRSGSNSSRSGSGSRSGSDGSGTSGSDRSGSGSDRSGTSDSRSGTSDSESDRSSGSGGSSEGVTDSSVDSASD